MFSGSFEYSGGLTAFYSRNRILWKYLANIYNKVNNIHFFRYRQTSINGRTVRGVKNLSLLEKQWSKCIFFFENGYFFRIIKIEIIHPRIREVTLLKNNFLNYGFINIYFYYQVLQLSLIHIETFNSSLKARYEISFVLLNIVTLRTTNKLARDESFKELISGPIPYTFDSFLIGKKLKESKRMF